MEYKLKEVLDYIHNYFIFDTYEGKIEIINHQINNAKIELYDGQYYMIKGSIFNDGIWKYEENIDLDKEKEKLVDEEFYGDIISLKIPKDVLKIVNDIIAWEEKNQDAITGIYQSESFGGYSYTLKNNNNNGNTANKEELSWKNFFGNKLKVYRKLG